jgi:stage V sporulation protein R
MELIDQRTKKIMEECKGKARAAGLSFEDETLEYIVTNRDLIELSPKLMIPTLYDYWIHDVEVLREKSRYELYPSNPYETVINTRPAISFYNDNNPDWMNVMIFYHVLAHIDFFQNNLYFSRTWEYDFNGQALSDKRLIAKLRSEKGRWLDYVIEFGRGIDNIVGYFSDLSRTNRLTESSSISALDYYFDVFLQTAKPAKTTEYLKEVDRYNDCQSKCNTLLEAEDTFFSVVYAKHPEFKAVYEKSLVNRPEKREDILHFLIEHSPFLKKEENVWMKSVLQVIRNTSLFFQPQIRTKIMNEGWASYWHEKLFLKDDRINGKEVIFARTHSGVTSLPRIGINPYALGMRLFQYIEDLKSKGRYSLKYRRLRDVQKREEYDDRSYNGANFIFSVRESLCDFTFINAFIDQDFVNRFKLFVAGKRLNKSKNVWEYYVKSRKAEDYRKMLEDSLYHPPQIDIDKDKSINNTVYLVHLFEGKPLVKEFISNTMMGIEYLWGDAVHLETNEIESITNPQSVEEGNEPQVKWQRVLYTMKDRKLSKKVL